MVKILCVEDEEDLRQDIVEELNDAGYTTIEAENGKVALEAIMTEKPDLVICDITMPVMDGHALLNEIRNNHPEKCDLPFLFLSALADRDNLVKGRKLGADAYLTKPVDYEMLLAAVESRLQSAQRVNARQQEQLVKVYKAAIESTARPPSPPVPETAPDGAPQAGTEDPSSIAQSLRDRVTATPTKVVAGRIQLVGLEEIKAALGDRWARRSEVIYDLIERTIKSRLGATDVYQQSSDGNFTICFAELSESEAAFKARAISQEIRAKILGKDLGQGAAALSAEDSAFLDEIAGRSGAGPALVVEGEAHEVEFAVEEVAQSDDLLGLLTARLEAAAKRSLKNERAVLMDIADNSLLRLYGFVEPSGEATPFQFAAFDADTQAKIGALRSHRPASEDLVRDLDVLLLTKVAEEIFERPPGRNVVLIVNIHFSTIDSKQRLEHLKKLCGTLTKPARAALIFNIVEIPRDLLPAKVAEQFQTIRHFCRAMMAECATPEIGNIDPQMLRTPILTFKATAFSKAMARDNGTAVQAFMKKLHLRRFRLLLYGNIAPRDRAKFRSLGVDFLPAE
ncbi:MAG: response regulator [Kiloniellaceae bacterium]